MSIGMRRAFRSLASALICASSVIVASTSVAQSVDKLRLADSRTVYSAHIIVADELKLFQKHGLEVEPKHFASGKLTLDAVMAGAADVSTSSETPISAAVMANRPITIVARMIKARPDILVHEESGIKGLADLKGKKVGILSGTSSEVVIHTAMRKAGLKPAEASFVNLLPQDMPAAISTRSVDAISIWQPHIYNAQRLLGAKARLLDTKDVYTESFNLVAMKEYASANPRAIRKLLAALLEAEAYLHKNKSEAQEIVTRVAGPNRPAIESSWGNFEYRIALDPQLIEVLETISRWRLETGNVPPGATKVPDYRPIISSQILQGVDATRVQGLR
jgi:ABC-type nitrate/sulfonate/bicarbonate transport system substrate-binding protein